ncbi:MAG: ankyrin repeat domain-containing protein [Brevinematia bacterium]
MRGLGYKALRKVLLVAVTMIMVSVFIGSCADGRKPTKHSKSSFSGVVTKADDKSSFSENVRDKNTSESSEKSRKKNLKSVRVYKDPLDKDLRISCVKGDSSGVINSIRKGADVNSRDDDGDTPLHLAVMLNNYEIVKLLVTYGANPYLRNRQGLSPIDIARDKGYEEIYLFLTKKIVK